MKANNVLTVEQATEETGAQALTRRVLDPELRNAVSASTFAGKVLGNDIEAPGLIDFIDHVQASTKKAAAGDLTIASRLLAPQAITLDTMFTELARRAGHNMGEYLDASERYGQLALRVQANSRAALEALAKHTSRVSKRCAMFTLTRVGRLSSSINSTTTPGGGTEMQKPPNNPMQPEPARLAAAPRCLAMTRKGTACQSPAIKGAKRCRMHGGKGSGAPEGNRYAWKLVGAQPRRWQCLNT